MLKELINQASNSKPLTDLRFIAVGGARVTPETIAAARAVGLPAYQGYGLSEAGSVVSLNMPHSDRICSVGRPLEHVKVRIAEDGEIIVQQISGRLTPGSIHVPTGDLGRIDADGFLYVEGRKKNQIITGFGRNVSPEWPESLLEDQEPIAQALVFEDDQSAVAALLVPVNVDISDEQLQSAVDRVNHGLPDYARISGWQRFEAGFTKFNGLATPNGRPKRAAILQQLREGTYS
jgi:long-subunit acyl-CoA synthetase (AMP-forming)